MSMIGRSKTADEKSGGFDDLMLKEWALKNLLSKEAGGGGGMVEKTVLGVSTGSIDEFLNSASNLGISSEIGVGSLVRASSADRSPFLLDDQELHKSVVLVISDDEKLSIGVILNRPAAKEIEIKIKDRKTGLARTESLPLRYGGQYAVRGSEPLLWLHCGTSLKSAKIGAELGKGKNGVYTCTADDVKMAIGQGIARPEDFLVVTGVCIWPKVGGGAAGSGMPGLIQCGKFEVIEKSKTDETWRMMLRQDVLSTINLSQNLAFADEAWLRGGQTDMAPISRESKSPPISGLGENCDEEDDTLVFKSDVKVADLSDKALRSWVATFLLGSPMLEE